MPSNGRRRLRLGNYLPYRLSVAANAVSQLIARAYEERFGLRVPQWRLIAVLADEGALTPQALCERTVMDKVTVTRAAQTLVRRRLVRREPNASDGRSHRLRLTEAGARLYRKIAPLALEYEDQLLEGIQEDEIERLKQQLRRLQEVAGSLGRAQTRPKSHPNQVTRRPPKVSRLSARSAFRSPRRQGFHAKLGRVHSGRWRSARARA